MNAKHDGKTLLHVAAAEGRTNSIQVLLEHKADIRATVCLMYSPFSYYVYMYMDSHSFIDLIWGRKYLNFSCHCIGYRGRDSTAQRSPLVSYMYMYVYVMCSTCSLVPRPSFYTTSVKYRVYIPLGHYVLHYCVH